jgi:hypothetical protein
MAAMTMEPLRPRVRARGRQPLPLEKRRICQFQAYLTMAERDTVQAYANRVNVATSDLIRHLLLEAAAS